MEFFHQDLNQEFQDDFVWFNHESTVKPGLQTMVSSSFPFEHNTQHEISRRSQVDSPKSEKISGFKKVMFSHDFHVFMFFDRRRCWASCSQPPVSRCWLWRLHGVAGGGGWGTEIPILHQHKLRINRQKFWLNKQTWWFDRHIVLFEHFWTCLNHVKAMFNMGFSSTIKIYTSLIFLARNPWHGIV